MFDLSGKTALITGASGGIGQAIAHALASRGARLAITGTRGQVLMDVAAKLPGEGHLRFVCDLSDAEAVDKLIPDVLDKMDGKLDILVNNAGVTRDNILMRMKDEEWDDVLNVNLKAAFRLMRAAAKPMMKARGGRIISVSSVVGAMGNPGQANYAASKAGLVGMSKSVAQELASRNITVNCVAPGFITTAMTDDINEDQKEALKQRIPAGKLGAPEDVAAAVAYLGSDEAAYVTGQTLHVNGGMIMTS